MVNYYKKLTLILLYQQNSFQLSFKFLDIL